jgi:hypothetical protein
VNGAAAIAERKEALCHSAFGPHAPFELALHDEPENTTVSVRVCPSRRSSISVGKIPVGVTGDAVALLC